MTVYFVQDFLMVKGDSRYKNVGSGMWHVASNHQRLTVIIIITTITIILFLLILEYLMLKYDLLNGVFNMLLLILLLFLHLHSSIPVPFSYHEARTLSYSFCHPPQCLQPFAHDGCNRALDLISTVCVCVLGCGRGGGGPYQ